MWRVLLVAAAIPSPVASLIAQETRAIQVNDASLMRQMPGAGIEYRLPPRVFPPELVAKLRSGGVYVKFLYRSFAQNAHKWTEIPTERWRDLISDFAPVSVQGNGGNVRTMGRCPFTGKLFRGATMTDDEFRDSPFQARIKGSPHIIYAREEDMPADYPARPNHTELIPHLDGTTHAYRFYVPDECRDAGSEFQSDRKHWFCPAGEVWRCRLRTIMAKVIPDLTSAVVLDDNAEAVKTLTAVLDRLADVYPELPLYIGARAHGFARGPDRKGYLTAEQYRSIASKQPFIHARAREDYPFWYVDIYDFSYAKLHAGVSAWTDGVMDQLGWIASAFDVIRDRPETLAFSQAKYGAPDAWENRFRERCLKEIEYLALATPPTTGNTSYAYINGSVKVGIATQNAALFRKGLEIIELYLYNNWSADGMAADAAFNYAAMTQGGILGLSWLNRFFGGVDLADRYGLKRTIDRLGIAPVTTLFNIQSKHADQHARFFRKQADAWGKPPATGEQDYGAHEASLCLPFYGLTALRGGVPGRRIELIVNHQNTWQHSHYDRLSYQLFCEGVECLPDFGYCVGHIDPQKKPWSDVRTTYELMGLPNTDCGRWGAWKYGYGDRPEAHGVLMVDHWLYASVPCQLHAFSGAATMDEPGWWAQFVDASAESLFLCRPNPVAIYRRQLAVLTLPNGAPVTLDVFRVRGGARHDLFWHVPGDRPAKMPSVGQPIAAPNWSAFQGLRMNYDRLTGKATHHYGKAGRLITNLKHHALPRGPWHSEWLIQPSRTFPEPKAWRQNYRNWPELLHDVRLGMWSYAAGSTAQGEMICARGPWPGGLTITDPASGESKTATVGLKDALDYRILTRVAEEPGLESIFVHALEARRPDQPAELAELTVEQPQALADGGGVVCRMKLASGGTGVFASTLGGKKFETPALALDGRMAALFPDAHRLTLVDGTSFRTQGWGLDLAPGWDLTLADVVGDLTGEPTEGALVVESSRPLPIDGTLAGHFVYVTHRCSPHLQSVYTIERVARLKGELWRIDLADAPPFITQRARVLKIDAEDPRQMEQHFQFHLIKGSTYSAGRRIRFLRSGFETALVETGRSEFTVADAPPGGAVAKGDPFIVYSIQAGDHVRIPSRFVCQGRRADAGQLRLAIASTGAATLQVPGAYQSALSPNVDVRRAGSGTVLRIDPGALKDGKGVIHLQP